MVLLVNKTSPYKTTRDLLEAAKKNPGMLTLGHAGVGSVSQLVGALFAIKAGVKFTEVPYKGIPPALLDLVGGRIDAVFDQSNTAMRNASSGPLSAIAITSIASMPLYPDAPPLASSGFPGFEATTWYGLYAPKGTPAVALQTLYKAYVNAMSDSPWRKAMSDNGIRLLPDAQYAPAAFAQHTADEIEKWRKVIAEAGISID
jgi:tripartite-type tricarboxylate transporter receptor subunit TctC